MTEKTYKENALYKGLDSLSLGVALGALFIAVGLAKSDNDMQKGLDNVAEAITKINDQPSITLKCTFDPAAMPSDSAVHPDILNCLKQREMIERQIGEEIGFTIAPE